MGPCAPCSQARAATSVLLFGEPFLEVFLEPAFFFVEGRGSGPELCFFFFFSFPFLPLTGQKDTVTWEDGFLASSKSRGPCPLSTYTGLETFQLEGPWGLCLFLFLGKGWGLVGFWGVV